MIPSHQSRRGEMNPHFLSVYNWILQDRSHQIVHPGQGHPKLGSDPNGCTKQVSASLPQVVQPTEERQHVRMLRINKLNK